MAQERLSIPNISCRHCVRTIERELGGMPGVTEVKGDADLKEVRVTWEAPATLEAISRALPGAREKRGCPSCTKV